MTTSTNKTFDERPYKVRRDERLAKDAAKLSHVERTLVAAVTQMVKAKLRGLNLAYALDVIAEGVVNAHDTIFHEGERERSEWAYMFVASMESLLADGTRALDLASTANRARVCAVFKMMHIEG